MPIRPEAKALYPKAWKAIRAQILVRARNKCERCGRPNGVAVLVCSDGAWNRFEWESAADGEWRDADGEFTRNRSDEDKAVAHVTKTVLTVAHLDHDPTNNAPENLRALCQRCHLSHDAAERARNARRTRDMKRGQGSLRGMEQ